MPCLHAMLACHACKLERARGMHIFVHVDTRAGISVRVMSIRLRARMAGHRPRCVRTGDKPTIQAIPTVLTYRPQTR
eukprot:365286-Chlamydomonas_euryale.AAC.6